MRYTFLALLAVLLAACSARALPGLPVATPAPRLISRHQAIDIAVKSASMSRPEVSPALATPTNIQAEQMTLAKAIRRIPGNAAVPGGYSPELPVWYVTMDGLWEEQMPAPGVTVTPGYYHHAVVILDAATGMEISGSLAP